MGGDLERLFAHLHRREMHGGAGGHGLTAGKATLAMGNDGGIAGNDSDILRRNAELFGADLGKRRLDPLAHGHGAGVDGDAAGTANAHDAGFERAATGAFDAVANADAEIAAALARSALALRKAGIADRLERGALAAGKVAAVEGDRRAGARLERKNVGHFFRRHEVAAADFRAVEVQFVGDAIKQAFHRESAFRITGAAHRHGRDLVGLGDAHVELERR
jgi:hypothetical protein